MATDAAQDISGAKGKNIEIKKRHLILCEGRDEQGFLIAYLNSAHLSATPGFSKDIQVMDFGGNDDLPKYLAVLKKTSGFDKVKTLLIVRDAERDVSSAIQQIGTALENNGFTAPAFILKEPDPPKLLETVDRFLDQLKTERGRDFTHRFKTRLHTCLAVSDKYVGMKIGEAAKAGAFDWSDERLTPLREFIQEKMCRG